MPREGSTATTATAAAAAAETPDAEPLDYPDGGYAEAPDYTDDGCWYPDGDTPGGGAGGGVESALAAEGAEDPARGSDSEGDALGPQSLTGKSFCDDVSVLPSPDDVGTAAIAAATTAAADDEDDEYDETPAPPGSPPLSPFVKPRSVSGGCSAESEEDEDSPMFRMPASQRHAVLHPARSTTTAAASVGAFALSPPAPLSPPSPSPPTLCLSGSSSTSSSPPPSVVENAPSMCSGRQRAGKASRWTGISLTQEAPSRKRRREAESVRAAAPTRGQSQPISGRPAMSVSLGPPEESPERSSAAGLHGGEGGVPFEVMPSFDRMTVQELAGMVSVYGLKKASKKWVAVMIEIDRRSRAR